ncbi:MAG: competence/damage-inducible protein A [Nitrospirae bacterium]|nr:competence/damage-inducible protein A [Nitrospirota bacterium]MBI3595112.1 competence/damage-inducible protein A [Nitrospirota bacterium]
MNGAEIITIGSELLLPWVNESNSSRISQILFSLGISVRFKSVVGDLKEDIAHAIDTALKRSHWVILSGGLGPTWDDVTREAVAASMGKPLILNQKVLQRLKKKFQFRKRRFLKIHERQAWFPKEAVLFPNSIGIADGFMMKTSDSFLISLPGVPAEMCGMMESVVSNFILKNSGPRPALLYKSYKTFGISESQLNEILKDLTGVQNVQIGLLAKGTGAEVSLLIKELKMKRAKEQLRKFDQTIQSRLKNLIYGVGEQSLEKVVGQELARRKKTLSIAESCTGGLVSHRLTNIPGSSVYFNGSAVTYSNRSKIEQLGVSPSLIKKYGAVSPGVALAMAEGIRTVSQSDYGLSITGIAGPGGGTSRKPIGLVYFGLSDRKGNYWEEARYPVDREAFKWFASSKALDMIRHRLQKT